VGAPGLGLLAALLLVAVASAAHADDEAVKRGAYLFAAADCAGCHTDVKNNGKSLAGGRALATPFGTFYGPNITPDPQNGIGDWTEAQFHRALREGINEHGNYMFPVFPFTSFTGLTDADISDLWAFLRTQAPVSQKNKRHEITPPFGFRFSLVFWRMLFFDEGPWKPDPAHDEVWNRGSYLANAVAHCGECHTPRNFMGAMKTSRAFSGNPQGPDGQRAPNITPDPEKGIGKWSFEDIETVLKTGQLPYFDTVGSGMAEVVKGTSQLTDDDRHAIAVYLKSVKPVPGS
jgi:mono/diheme cytochrome c family protein